MELDKGFDPIVKYNLTEIVKMYFVVLKAIKCIVFCRDPNEEEEDPHPRGFWLILLPHSPGNEIFDSSYSSFLEE